MTLIIILQEVASLTGTARTARNRLLPIASQVFQKIGRKSDRVCSIHFIDGIPTAANPVPTLRLRKRSSKIQERVVLPAAPKERKTEKDQQTLTYTTENCSNDKININCGCENTSSIIAIKHLYCKLESANQCLSNMC